MNTTNNFTGLLPNSNYNVSVFSQNSTCLEIPATVMITTLKREAGVPESELILLDNCVPTYSTNQPQVKCSMRG